MIPHLDPGMIPSTVDPDAAGQAERGSKSKKAVKISAWKLAKLDAVEAVKAAAKARASSSVLRPIDGRHRLPAADAASSDFVSSDNASVASSASMECGTHMNNPKIEPEYENCTPTASSLSSPARTAFNEPTINRIPSPANVHRPLGPRATLPRASVVWDQLAGRYVSVINPTAANQADNTMIPRPTPGAIGQERLMYTGQSIFFGGPLLNAAVRDGRRNEGGTATGSRPEIERALNAGRGEGRRDSFPVFVPGGFQRN